ncbi:hypothetical protein BGZ67_009037 [Mortierella alpina]|nr:hypothetical protein BGZ67_009037 [Mortierella alpina]
MYVNTLAAWAALAVNLTSLLTPSTVNERGVLLRIEPGLSNAGGHIPTIKVNIAGNTPDGELYPSMLRRTRKKPFNRDTVDGGPRSLNIVTNSNLEIQSLDIRMDAYRNGKRGPRISLNDEMCLASLVWTPRDTRPNYDSRRGAITGDLMYFCGYNWYPSGKVYNGYELRCGWLDGDDSLSNSVKGLFLDLDKFGKGFLEAHARVTANTSSFCSNGIRFYPGNLPLSKRSVVTESNNNSIATTTAITLTPMNAFRNKAFLSTRVSAVELCDDPTSYGPSMVNTREGIFCDMTTKTKVPMCDSNRTERCMDFSRLQKRDPALYRNLEAKNVPPNLISYSSFQIEYFTLTDVNGTIIDNGSNI